MKTTHILIAAFVGLMFSTTAYAQNTNTQDAVKTDQSVAQGDTLVFTIYGMDCPGCEIGLEKQINKIESIKYSNANWHTQELKIVMVQDSTLNSNELEKRVKKANFTLDKESIN